MTIFHRINLLTPMTLALLGLLTLTGLSQTALGEDNRTIACLEPPLERYGTAIEEPVHQFNLSPDCVVQVPGEPGTDDENRHLGVGLCFPELSSCNEESDEYYELYIANQYEPEVFTRTIKIFRNIYEHHYSTSEYDVYVTPTEIAEENTELLQIYIPKNNHEILLICGDSSPSCTIRGILPSLEISYSLYSESIASKDWLGINILVEDFIMSTITNIEKLEN